MKAKQIPKRRTGAPAQDKGFAAWLSTMPAPRGAHTLNLAITLTARDWMRLARCAKAERIGLAQAAARLLTDHEGLDAYRE